jgi:hypothetical protein
MALLYFTKVTTCSTIAEAFDKASHDRLTRMLNSPWSGHTLLHLALRTLFPVAGGYLIVDDTVVAKPYARLLGEAAWVWSSKDSKVVFGVSLVLLVWTDGQVRIPLAYRVWQKGGVSKYDLALEWLSYARNRLKCKPQFVLFDSWYPSQKLLKRIRDYGWYFVCQLNRYALPHISVHMPPLVLHADFGHIPGIIPDGDVFPHISGQGGIDIAQGLEAQPILMHAATLRHGQEQEIQLFERYWELGEKALGTPPGLGRETGGTMGRLMVLMQHKVLEGAGELTFKESG